MRNKACLNKAYHHKAHHTQAPHTQALHAALLDQPALLRIPSDHVKPLALNPTARRGNRRARCAAETLRPCIDPCRLLGFFPHHRPEEPH
jgi:hypothetical protein